MLGTAFLFDKEVEDVTLPGGQVVTRDMPKAPDLTVNGLVRKSWLVGSEGKIDAQVSFDWTDDSYSSVTNAPATFLESYTIVDARISYFGNGGQWWVALFGKNITDEEAKNFTYDLSDPVSGFGINIQSWRPPRTVGAEFHIEF